MNPEMIFLPVLVQITLSLVVFIALGQSKERAIKLGEVDASRRALHADAWPESVQKINNSIRNQFETPIVFYVLILSLWALGAAGILAQVLAWAYALTRVAHAYVHIGSNYVPLRKRLFQLSIVLLFIMTGLTLVAMLF
jgi:hypothetical protein